MSRHRSILIGCPQYHCIVHGSYDCDEQGNYLLGPGGEFILAHATCGHRGGKCAQTLCALHRHNRAGQGSWFPSGIWAMRQGRAAPPPAPPTEPHVGQGGWYA